MKKQQKTILIILGIVISIIILMSLKNNIPTLSSSGFLSVTYSDGTTKKTILSNPNSLTIPSQCTPDNGFNHCEQQENIQTYQGLEVRSYAKTQINTLSLNNQKGGYYIGDISIPYKFTGDKHYLYENFGTWENLWNNIANCDEEGCSGAKTTLQQEGSFLLISPGQEYHGCPGLVSYDYECIGDCGNYQSPSPWVNSYITSSWGWAGSSNCLDIKSVECYDNSDCSQGEICDKSGDWTTWNCKIQQGCAGLDPESCMDQLDCVVGWNDCIDLSSATCSDIQGEAISSQYPAGSSCNKKIGCKLGEDSSSCVTDNGGYCTIDSDCPGPENIGSPFCFNNQLLQESKYYICSSGTCSEEPDTKLIKNCECTDYESKCKGDLPDWLNLDFILIVIFIILIIVYLLRRKKKHGKQRN